MATYGLHSLLSGSATLVAADKVPDYIFQAHGAWKTSKWTKIFILRFGKKTPYTSATQY
jgi:hypothetical protein